MTSDYMRDTSIPITARQMKTTSFIVFLLLSANSMAEEQSDDSWLDEVDAIYAEQEATPPWEADDQKLSGEKNPYDQFDKPGSVMANEDPFAEFDEPDPPKTTGSSTPTKNIYDQFDPPANKYQKYTGNRFEKYAKDQDEGFVIPPIPEWMKPESAEASEKEETITHYSSRIKPGAKVPDDVYECVLKNIRGVGSDVAAAMVWQSCLRLNLK